MSLAVLNPMNDQPNWVCMTSFKMSPSPKETAGSSTGADDKETQVAEVPPCNWQHCTASFATSEELGQHILKEHINASAGHGEKASTKCMWSGCIREVRARTTQLILFELQVICCLNPQSTKSLRMKHDLWKMHRPTWQGRLRVLRLCLFTGKTFLHKNEAYHACTVAYRRTTLSMHSSWL